MFSADPNYDGGKEVISVMSGLGVVASVTTHYYKDYSWGKELAKN